MANARRTSFATPSTRPPRPLENLERIQAVYFTTPDLEREIDKLDGVTSCRVLSTGTEIEEIHVIAPPDRIPKKIVRNIESLLLVKFGIRIDHRKVSVVQMGSEGPTHAAPGRPQIQKIERRSTADTPGQEVSVLVRAGDQTIEGLGQSEPGEPDLYASSRALLRAIETLINKPGTLQLLTVTSVQARGHNIMLAVVNCTLAGQTEVLVGASVARTDPLEDAARATFDALNRKLVRAFPTR